MVEGILALTATVAALAGAGSLVQSALKDRRLHLWVWAAATGLEGLALAALGIGQFAGYSGPVFRMMAITGALLAPMCVAVGAVELCVKPVQARFAARLIAISYSLVALVILILDPLQSGSLGKSPPHPKDVYGLLPGWLLTGTTVLAVIALVAAAVTVVVRSQKRDKEAHPLLVPAAVAVGAGLVGLVSVGFLPGLLKILGMAVSAGLVWFAAWRTAGSADGDAEEKDDEERPRRARGSREANASRTERRDIEQKEAEDEMAYEPPRSHRARPDTHGMMRPEPPQPPQPPRHATGSRPMPPQPPVPQQGPPTLHSTGPMVADDWFASPPQPPQPPQPSRIMGPYGQMVVYTLLDGREPAFDRQINQLIGQAVQAEPGILIFTCHEVEGAPTQRISYQLFRDREAFEEHQGRPYLHRFKAESRTHVLATNVIDLKLTGGSLPVLR